jgi:putative membrane protein
MFRWFLAFLHLLALGIGLGSIWIRGRAFGRVTRGISADMRQLFAADTGWGIAALIWIVSGLIRVFGGVEKGTSYYLYNEFFRIKMGLLIVILLLELWPMVTLIRWRIRLARGITVNTAPAQTFARISFLQAVLVVLMVGAATAMARGYGVLTH